MSLAELRLDYQRESLNEADADPDPFRQFQRWMEAALSANLREPYAMTLATATTTGLPAARTVLLRGCDPRGFVFFSNYESRKGRELETNPVAALLLYWAELERQVRIEGAVEQTTAAESDAYFQARPRESRLSAVASPQSEVIAARSVLEARMTELQAAYPGDAVPRPEHWGGYRVIPHTFEFWQGGLHRLHDRLRFRLSGANVWVMDRLAP